MSPIGPMQRHMLDAAIKFAVDEGVVFEDWQQFRNYLAENGNLEASQLEEEQNFVFGCYLKYHKVKKQESSSHPDTPPKSPSQSEPPGPAQLVDCGEEATFSPSLDKSQTRPSETLSIFVKHQNTWDGVGWDFCKEDDSFISTAVVKRDSLEVKDNRTQLTWRFHGEKKTYKTWFITNEDENMENDIMLGKNWKNVESQPTAGPPSNCYDQGGDQPIRLTSPTDEQYPEQPGYLNSSPSQLQLQTEATMDIEATAARMNVQSAILLNLRQHQHQHPFILQPPGDPLSVKCVEDTRSDSSGSLGQHPERQPPRPPFLSGPQPRGGPRNTSIYTPMRPPEARPPR